jgi:hypothetical protein
MQIYLVEYRERPSGPDKSVILANTEEEARELAKGVAYKTEDVQSIKSISLKDYPGPATLYTGYHCC